MFCMPKYFINTEIQSQDMQNFIDSEMNIFPHALAYLEVGITFYFWCPTVITGSVFSFLLLYEIMMNH